jgi:hypothetical protein
MSQSLEISRLEKVRRLAAGKIIARCPACAEVGSDRTGNHLAIFPDGRFACAAHAGDEDHRKRVFALVGIHSEPDPEQRREWQEQRTREQRRQISTKHLVHTARKYREALVKRYEWHPADVWDDSPQRIDSRLVASCPCHFLASQFSPDSFVWTGEVHHSGKPEYSTCWKPCSEWFATDAKIGPMTTPATWRPGIYSRSGDNVVSAPYTVLDFDGFDGVKPHTPNELREHFRASLALIRWLREDHHWQLSAIVATGGKSLHAWFQLPPSPVLQSLRETAAPLGIDAGLLGRPEHPCRLPGQVHSVTGRSSHVLWLQLPVQ